MMSAPWQRQAPRRFGEHEVVADQHADRAQVRRGEDRERFAALPAAALAPGRADLVVAADLLAVAAEEERRVVGLPVGLHEIAAHDQIHAVLGGGAAQPVEHALDRLGQDLLRRRLVHAAPVEQTERVLRQRQHVAPGVAGLVDDLLQLVEILVHGGEDFGRFLESPVNRAAFRLARGDAHDRLALRLGLDVRV